MTNLKSKDIINIAIKYGEVAQLARASGSYPAGREFESPLRYQVIRINRKQGILKELKYLVFKLLQNKKAKFVIGKKIYNFQVIIYTIIVISVTVQICKTDKSLETNAEIKESKREEVIKQQEDIVKVEKENKKVTLGETIKEKDWEVKIKETGFKQDIIPSNPNTYYTHYQVKDTNNTYFYLAVEAKNISSLGLRADGVAKVKVKYNDKYEYTAFSTIEESGGGTFTYTNITDISPLTTRTVYYLVELPQTIAQETDTQLKAEISINDNTYELKIR